MSESERKRIQAYVAHAQMQDAANQDGYRAPLAGRHMLSFDQVELATDLWMFFVLINEDSEKWTLHSSAWCVIAPMQPTPGHTPRFGVSHE